ncbi:MAG: hydrolase [Frankiales bacterium]|nr:hydrolase [Frankiales bacterium]
MPTLRRAVPADAAELVRLRSLMHEAMGTDASDPDYQQACTAAFARRLAGDPSFVAFVVEGDDGGLLASGVGFVEEHLPSPTSLDGRRGHVASMSTDPRARRQGHARQVLEALLRWMREEQGLGRVDLRATPDGQPLYEQAGFRVLGGATMSWTAPGVRPGMPQA